MGNLASKIHATAIIEDSVILGKNVEVGPYTVIEGNTTIGDNTKIGPFCYLGGVPQDRKYTNLPTFLTIGSNCRISDRVMIEGGTTGTNIGNNCFFMTACGIAHDTIIEFDVTFGPYTGCAGTVHVGDSSFIGISTHIHQNVRVGRGSMLGAHCFVKRDVLPYSLVEGSKMKGVNLVGMRRAGIDNKSIKELSTLYKKILKKEMSLLDMIANLEDNYDNEYIKNAVNFITRNSKRRFLLGSEK